MSGDVAISGLLDCAQRLLSDEIAPHLDPDRRYLALMIGSAMRMAARQAEQSDRLSASQRALLELSGLDLDAPDAPPAAAALADAIRDGAFDSDARAHGLLWTDAVVRASVTKPSALLRIERRMAGLPGEDMNV